MANLLRSLDLQLLQLLHLLQLLQLNDNRIVLLLRRVRKSTMMMAMRILTWLLLIIEVLLNSIGLMTQGNKTFSNKTMST